jgi:hypothetical protein
LAYPQAHPPFGHYLVILVPVRVGRPISGVARPEIVQVAVSPTHDGLQDLVKAIQRNIARDQDTPPDRRTRAAQNHFELQDQRVGVSHGVLLGADCRKGSLAASRTVEPYYLNGK